MIINESSLRVTNNEEREFVVPVDKDRVVTSVNKPTSDFINRNTNEIEQTHHDEEHENESNIQTNDTRSIENLERNDRYNLRNRNSIKSPSRYEACFAQLNEPKTSIKKWSQENTPRTGSQSFKRSSELTKEITHGR